MTFPISSQGARSSSEGYIGSQKPPVRGRPFTLAKMRYTPFPLFRFRSLLRYASAGQLAVLAGCAPSNDGLYTVIVSTQAHSWLEIEPLFDMQHNPPQEAQYRVWYMHQTPWQWQPECYDLSGGPVPNIPIIRRLSRDTFELTLRGRPLKYTFRGPWPAAQCYR